jgi:hypothetical protein
MYDAFDGVQWRWMGKHAVLHANHESGPVFRVLVRCVEAELHRVSDSGCDTSPPCREEQPSIAINVSSSQIEISHSSIYLSIYLST